LGLQSSATLGAADELAIRKLYAVYCQTLDAGIAAAWAQTFVAEGSFHHPAATFTGRAELERFVRERSGKLGSHPVVRQRHWNDRIGLCGGGDGATGECDLLVAGMHRETGRPEVVAQGRYEDRLVRTSEGWRFSERRLLVE
jgi:hypothetical protein